MSPSKSEKISSAYKSEKKKLLGYISRRVPARVEAEDILQDVFYQLTVGFRISTGSKTLRHGYTG